MIRFAPRLGVLVIATLAFAGLGTAPANAAVAPAVSFVGTYTTHVDVNGHGYRTSSIMLFANHTGVSQGGGTATWTNVGRTITITAQSGTNTETFIGKRTKRGLSNKKHPGTFSDTRGDTGVWYAVQTA
jgi:hypothetical protein